MAVGVISIFAALKATGHPEAEPSTDPQAGALPVETITLQTTESYHQRRTYTGVVKARRVSELSFSRMGKLSAMLVDEGCRVEQGQTLARLSVRNLKAKQRQLTAQRAAAKAVLAELLAGPRPETIAAARAEVRGLEAQWKLRRLNHQRNESLVASKSIAPADFDHTAHALESAEAQLEAARRQLEELEAGTRQEKIDAQQAAVEQLDAALSELAVQLEESALTAPFDGVVSKTYFEEGAVVAPGSPVVRLVETGELEAWIGLPVEVAAALKAGQEMKLDVSGRSHDAVVEAILPEVDLATRTRSVVFQLENVEGNVVPGEIARVKAARQVQTPGYWLPAESLTRNGRGLWTVYAVEADPESGRSVVASRMVEVLHTSGERMFVRGAVASGDRIIARGVHRLAPGQHVDG